MENNSNIKSSTKIGLIVSLVLLVLVFVSSIFWMFEDSPIAPAIDILPPPTNVEDGGFLLQREQLPKEVLHSLHRRLGSGVSRPTSSLFMLFEKFLLVEY